MANKSTLSTGKPLSFAKRAALTVEKVILCIWFCLRGCDVCMAIRGGDLLLFSALFILLLVATQVGGGRWEAGSASVIFV